MSKQLNELTGKGALLAMGQTSVANFLSMNSQADLAAKIGYFKKGKPNSGAVYNALKDLGWLPESKRSIQKSVANFDKSAQQAVKATGEFVGPPIERFLPGRIELLLEMLGHDVHITGVLNAIEENSVPWCTQVRKMGEDERALMRDYTGMTAWTLADIAHENREEKRLRPFKASAETVAKFAGIDAGLVQRESRFESSRYDADIVTFYCAD